jgi:hypothetical protein
MWRWWIVLQIELVNEFNLPEKRDSVTRNHHVRNTGEIEMLSHLHQGLRLKQTRSVFDNAINGCGNVFCFLFRPTVVNDEEQCGNLITLDRKRTKRQVRIAVINRIAWISKVGAGRASMVVFGLETLPSGAKIN